MADKKIVAHPKVLQKLKWDIKAQGWAIIVSEVVVIGENKKEKLQKKIVITFWTIKKGNSVQKIKDRILAWES